MLPAQQQKSIYFFTSYLLELKLQVSSMITSTTEITAAIFIEIVIIITAVSKNELKNSNNN
jgi:hypothetical protein